MNRYLAIAARVLSEVRQPLSATEILRIANQLQIVPEDLYGKTQHKTLHARLAENILKYRLKSEFVRTEPGRFFLRSLISDRSIPSRYRKQYFASLRADQLRKFQVLCMDKSALEAIQREHGCMVELSYLSTVPVQYKSLIASERDPTVVHARVIVVLRRNGALLFRRSYVADDDQLSARKSLGLLGFVKLGDKTLFSADRFGVHEAALRTISEQLYLPLSELNPASFPSICPEVLLIESADSRIRNAVAAVVCYALPIDLDPVESNNDRASFYWQDDSVKMNDLEKFDSWSRQILQSTTLMSATHLY